ncbi:Nuclear import receptor [Coemansia sp. RSA 1853]|nr:Nuclear import receptor [Coemansia sp. RSA 1853]
MADQTSANEVIRALNALYQGTNLEEREQANAWLEQFQKTTQAWTTADAMLGTSTLGLEAKLFAAQTLRNKIILGVRELGEQGALSLRDSMVGHLRGARGGAQALITQLCLGLADLAVQVGSWTDPFGDMAGMFLSDAQSVSCLLEFLAVLPEEFLNERVVVDGAYYSQRSEALLGQRAGDVIKLLVQCLQQPDLHGDAHTRVLVCFTSWLRHGDITLAMVQDTPLVALAFAALAEDGDVFDTAVDAVCGVLYETRMDRDDDAEAARAKDVMVEQLEQRLAVTAAAMRSEASDIDPERMQGLCRVFTEAGEAWVDRIVRSVGQFEAVVAALVDCMRLGSLDAVGMTFAFWGLLADRTVENTASCDPARRTLARVFEALVDVAIAHLKYPEDTLTAKERDEFREFRHGVGDVLKDCVRVAGQGATLRRAYALVAAGIGEKDGDATQGTSELRWQDAEAALFAVRAMGAEVSPSENTVLPKIMDMLNRLPAHPKLRYAATLVIGRYTEWTHEHPQYVSFQLAFIADGFKERTVAAASAQALKYLCQDCAVFLANHWRDVLGFFGDVASGTLDAADVVEISVALAHVISAVPAPDTALAIEAFCMPVGRELGALLQQTPIDTRAVALLLDRLGAFLRYVHIDDNDAASQLMARIVGDAWPLAQAALERVGGDSHVSESAAKFVRVLVEFYSSVLRLVAPQIIDAVVLAFQQTGLDVYLWLARRIVSVGHTLAADETSSLQLTSSLVTRLCDSALVLFRTTPFSDVPETTEEFFRLLERAVEAAPAFIIQSPSFALVFGASVAALDVNHFHAQSAVLRAWAQILSPTRRHIRMMRDATHTSYPVATIVELCTEHGLALCAKLLLGLLRTFDRELVPEAADVFASLAAVASDGPAAAAARSEAPFVEWVQAVLAQVPDASFAPAEKLAFVQALADAVLAHQWPKIKVLVADVAAVFWRRNNAQS